MKRDFPSSSNSVTLTPAQCVAIGEAYWNHWLVDMLDSLRDQGFLLCGVQDATKTDLEPLAQAVSVALTGNHMPNAADEARAKTNAANIHDGSAHRFAITFAGAAAVMGLIFTTAENAGPANVNQQELCKHFIAWLHNDRIPMLEEMALAMSTLGLYFTKATTAPQEPLALRSEDAVTTVASAMFASDVRREFPRLSPKAVAQEVSAGLAEGRGHEMLAAGLEAMSEAGYEIVDYTDTRSHWDRSDLGTLHRRCKWLLEAANWQSNLRHAFEALARCGMTVVEGCDEHAPLTCDEMDALGEVVHQSHLQFRTPLLPQAEARKIAQGWTKDGLSRLCTKWLLGALTDNGLVVERAPS